MFSVCIYFRDGSRKFIDHVTVIRDSTVQSIEVQWCTDFGDHFTHLYNKSDIAHIKMGVEQ
jgi:hypothetical protein